MATPRKTKSDTVGAALLSAKTVTSGMPKPTAKLDAAEMKFFQRAIESKNTEDITPIDLDNFTHLARVLRQQELAMDSIKLEGQIIPDRDGRPTVNPSVRALDAFSKSVATICRLLGVSASQRGSGNSAQQKARDKADRLARGAIANASASDELI